jgi:hypothetical protein
LHLPGTPSDMRTDRAQHDMKPRRQHPPAPVVYASADCTEIDAAVEQAVAAALREPSKYKHTAPGLFYTPKKRRDDAAKVLHVRAVIGPHSQHVGVNAPYVHEEKCLCGCGGEIVGSKDKKFATPKCKAKVRAARERAKRLCAGGCGRTIQNTELTTCRECAAGPLVKQTKTRETEREVAEIAELEKKHCTSEFVPTPR